MPGGCAGGIAAVVRTLEVADTSEIKELAMTCILRLSIGAKASSIRQELAEVGAPALLVAQVLVKGDGDAECHRLHHCAAGALGCLARGDHASRDAVCEAGGIEALVERLGCV